MLDLEGYEDSDREVLFNHQNKPSPSNPKHQDQETQMFPFSPQDQVVSGSKCFTGPCYACRSEKHWLRDHLKRGDYNKLKEKKLVKGPSKAYKIAMYAMEALREASKDEVSTERPGTIRK